MKKSLFTILCFILGVALLCIGVTEKPVEVVTAEEVGGEPITFVCVYGESQISATPDKVVIFASIENISSNLAEAKDESFNTLNKVVEVLGEQNITQDKIVVESFSTYPNYDYSSGKKLLGYNCIINFNFEIADINYIKPCLESLDKAGDINLISVNYKVSNENELYENALNQAFENARIKASVLLGKDNLSIVNIEEESTYYCNTLYRNYAQEIDNSIMIGKVIIKAKVKVKFC